MLHAKLFRKEEFFVLYAKFCRKIRFARSAAVAVGISERGKSLLDFLIFHVNKAGLPDVASLTCAEAGGISERGKSCSVWHRLFVAITQYWFMPSSCTVGGKAYNALRRARNFIGVEDVRPKRRCL